MGDESGLNLVVTDPMPVLSWEYRLSRDVAVIKRDELNWIHAGRDTSLRHAGRACGDRNWEAKTSGILYRRLRAGESLIGALESFARPSGEMVGGHCEDATFLTGAFMYLQVIE